MESKYNNAIIRWSKIATIIFIACCVVADAVSHIIGEYICYVWADRFDVFSVNMVTATIVAGSLGGYVILGSVFKLLSNMSKDIVFDTKNTKLMGLITIALVWAAVCATVGGFFWNGSFVLAVIALFMALIVLSVKVVFDKAIIMKEDLDLTI